MTCQSLPASCLAISFPIPRLAPVIKTTCLVELILHLQQLESMLPFIANHSWYAPENTQWFNGLCRFSKTKVGCFPTKLIKYRGNFLFSSLIVAANKHSWLSTGERWINHI